MHGFFVATGRFAVRFRWVVVLAWLAGAVLAHLLLPSLASVAEDHSVSQLPAGSPSELAARLATPFQRSDQTPVPVVIARNDGALTAADLGVLQRLATGLSTVTYVQQVKDLGVSRDGQAAELQVLANVSANAAGPDQQLVTGLRHTITSASLPHHLRAHLAGPLAAAVDTSQTGQRTLRLGQDLSILFIIILLLVVFRAVLAPLLTLVPAVVVIQIAGPLIAEATKAGLQVSQLTEIMLIILVLGAGADFGLFLVFRVREELRAGRSPHDAVAFAVSRVGESITFSAATVIAALLTLLLATFSVYSTLGLPLAIALAVMLLAGLTLMPALLAIFGRVAFWPSRTTHGSHPVGWWGRTASHIVARPAVTLGLGLVAFGGLATAALSYTPAGLGIPPTAAGSDSAAGNAVLRAHFPAASQNPTIVLLRFPVSAWSDPAPALQAEMLLAKAPEFNSVAGPFDVNGVALTPRQLTLLHAKLGDPGGLLEAPPAASGVTPAAWATYRAETQFISSDGRTVLFTVSLRAGDADSNAALQEVPAIRAAAAGVARSVGARAVGVVGDAPATYDVSHASDGDLLRIFPVAILVIAFLLAIVMRSLVAPVYLIASVALSYLAALGVSVLLFQDVLGASGLSYFVPFLMFIFLLALGEDYNILIMSRIREEAAVVPLRRAVARALERTGSTITSAGLILAGTFGVFAVVVSQTPGGAVYRDILASVAIGILMDAFLVRTLLVPSTVALLGPWNWWPARHGHAAAANGPGRRPAREASSRGAASR
jgi:RND superfamily putative drug exporter